ncbi:hypothetical protein ACLESO_06860 [Pyxidicoccus sp. 3LG]
MRVVPPRLYAMVATRAPVAAVFRRGPAGYWHVGRWDLVSGEYEPGAWARSPDTVSQWAPGARSP